jgi:hypothetical protein
METETESMAGLGIGMPKDLRKFGLISQFYTVLQDPRSGLAQPSVCYGSGIEPNLGIETCKPIEVLEGGCCTYHRAEEFEDIRWFAT